MELNIISCNIRFDNPADGQNSWPFRREFLTQTLLKHSPDLISTQEGRIQQLGELKASLGNFELMDQHRSWIGERMYPTIFIRENKFEFLGSGDVWLSETPDVAGSRSFESAFPRLMTWSKLQLKNSAQKFLIINTHLDHVKSETRQRQITVLVEEVQKLWDKQSQLIFMGDYNDSPNSQVREILIKSFPQLQDAWRNFHKIEETSHHSFKGENQNGSRIDWVLVDERLKIVSCEMDKCSVDGFYPTDHYPIVCRIKV